jgi:hypothetical protein
MKTRPSILVLGSVLVAATLAASAQEPVQNIDPNRHGNLAAAQRLVRQAYDRVTDAQKDNRYDLGGHASRAKDLLRQANEELKLSAEAANRR